MSAVVEHCGENSLQIVRALPALLPIMWPLVKQLFISPPLWSICCPPSIFQVCVCVLRVCAHHPTVPQPSGRLAVVGGESPPQVKSWLIAPHSHTAHPYRHTHTNTDTHSIFLRCSAGRREEGRINPNCGVWEPAERPGLLGASP